MRLQKFLAHAGIASRRKSEELILQGHITVNGEIVRELGTKINPKTDIISYKGKEVKHIEKKVYYMLNKPVGYVSTVKDGRGRKTVVDLLASVEERIYPVGRLDYDTSGLLLLTNDGDLTYKITHPKHGVEKTYHARVDGIPGEKQLENFRKGIIIDNRRTSKAKIEILSTDNSCANLSITITEGRNRQVRKMCAAIGVPVIKLKRVAIGKIKLNQLESGKYRPLTQGEISFLKSL